MRFLSDAFCRLDNTAKNTHTQPKQESMAETESQVSSRDSAWAEPEESVEERTKRKEHDVENRERELEQRANHLSSQVDEHMAHAAAQMQERLQQEFAQRPTHKAVRQALCKLALPFFFVPPPVGLDDFC